MPQPRTCCCARLWRVSAFFRAAYLWPAVTELPAHVRATCRKVLSFLRFKKVRSASACSCAAAGACWREGRGCWCRRGCSCVGTANHFATDQTCNRAPLSCTSRGARAARNCQSHRSGHRTWEGQRPRHSFDHDERALSPLPPHARARAHTDCPHIPSFISVIGAERLLSRCRTTHPIRRSRSFGLEQQRLALTLQSLQISGSRIRLIVPIG